MQRRSLGVVVACCLAASCGRIGYSEEVAADAAPISGSVLTLAGGAEAGTADLPVARFSNPVNVAVHPSGDLIVADFANDRLRRVSGDGSASTIVTETDGTFIGPVGLAVYEGTLYAQSDQTGGGALWAVDLVEGGAERIADIGRAHGLAAHPGAGLIVPDRDAHVVRILEPETLSFTFLAGAEGESGSTDGQGSEARFAEPHGAVALPGGDILIADTGNHVIRRVTLAGEVSTFAGTGEPGTTDGFLLEASFHRPRGVTIDEAGVIYVSCAEGHVIRRIDGESVRTVAGSGAAGFADSEADPLAAQFFGLGGIAAAGPGIIYAADGNRGLTGEPYHRIRVITLD